VKEGEYRKELWTEGRKIKIGWEAGREKGEDIPLHYKIRCKVQPSSH